LENRKKIISTAIKILIGIGSFIIVYLRLKTEFTAEKISILLHAFLSQRGFIIFIICLFFILVNWGIEAFKWLLITKPIEKINYITASKSVYSGICLGNLAPGRATEFIAKIIFFKPENRAKITVLHFINGMFQLSVTYLIGLSALLFKLNKIAEEYVWLAYTTFCISLVVFSIFIFCLIKIDYILNLITKKINKNQSLNNFKYTFSKTVLFQLFGLSAIRYMVFFTQYYLLLTLFQEQQLSFTVFVSIAIYYLITTTIPMISIIEAPIRAAIALIVFQDLEISNSVVALTSILIWLFNIILPSIYGYIVLVKQNFDFKLFNSSK
jgi:hypothetical protein